ncbi:MAG TPA: hypothetical protein VJT82_08015, partial [Pyrinomonadaceae bacterium]|nr:hypothetical protein [Pyrinomonadaceae bacterium]
GRERLHLTETPDVSHITNPDVMHEESDVSVRGVGTFVGLLFLGLIIVAALMFGMFKVMDAYALSKDPKPSPMARSERERLPPPGAPRLQGAPDHKSLDDPNLVFEKKEPTLEWDALREKYQYELENYGDVNPGTQTLRIPIEEAKKKVLEKGLPVRQQQQQSQVGALVDGGMDVPSYSSAGRQTEKRHQ